MDKVNEFEHGIDEARVRGSYGVRFTKEARQHYTHSDLEKLLENPEQLSDMIQHHKEKQVPRLDALDDYYEGGNVGILQENRRIEKHLADHRASHNFAEYVSQFIQGYMVGIPISVQHEKDAANEKLNDLNTEADADAHNSDLILDLSIYGRAYELLHRNYEDQIRMSLLSPLETFVIYSDTVDRQPLAGIRHYKPVGGDKTLKVEVYTANRIYRYHAKDLHSVQLEFEGVQDHYFGGVPIIEYSNNRFRQGDFEKVIPLIDLYDAAQSDTANYMTDLNDAMLVIKGNLELDVEEAKNMKSANLLFLQAEVNASGQAGQADAGYIYKQYDVTGVEKYKERIENDIHKFTNTPDMNDDKFGGNQTGVAMVYKLFGLEQKRAIKERLFKRSMMQRYRLINNIMKTAAEGAFDPAELTITFTPNLPEDISEKLATFIDAGGQLSQETLLKLISSLVPDAKKELDRLEAEKPVRPSYDFQTPTPTQPTETEEVSDDANE